VSRRAILVAAWRDGFYPSPPPVRHMRGGSVQTRAPRADTQWIRRASFHQCTTAWKFPWGQPPGNPVLPFPFHPIGHCHEETESDDRRVLASYGELDLVVLAPIFHPLSEVVGRRGSNGFLETM